MSPPTQTTASSSGRSAASAASSPASGPRPGGSAIRQQRPRRRGPAPAAALVTSSTRANSGAQHRQLAFEDASARRLVSAPLSTPPRRRPAAGPPAIDRRGHAMRHSTLRIQVAVFDAGHLVLERGRDGGVDVLAVDGLEAELLAEVALGAVGDQVQAPHALPAGLVGGGLDQQVAEALAAAFGDHRQHAQQGHVLDPLDADAADDGARPAAASAVLGITR